EREWFRQRCGVGGRAFRTHNLVDRPRITWRDIADADAIIIGGSGEYSVFDDLPFIAPLTEVVLRLAEEARPVFGVCWGHQFIAQCLGGRVMRDLDATEIGTIDVQLTDVGRADPLFTGMPPTFAAQAGHRDRVVAVPPRILELASNPRCRYQAIRLAETPIYGTQFHGEMSAEQLSQRLELYREDYVPDTATFDRIRKSLRPSPQAEGLLRRFLDLYT
ncbi:MAG: type 1 glutamine amidotransferase, partial [Acidobacteria bacterium]|nr:type 1 glutamine amidotransferase [Acidobacteriota bacterium]